ncbi:dihydroorotate dehydrogenase [Spirochaetia bacterium]|nr:dihydroorotate dehydrogenase [Spirochaetia bacterium]
MNNNNPDLSVCIAGVKFSNPVIAASGTFGYGKEYAGMVNAAELGGVCTKGLTLKARTGNKGVRIWETPSGLLNSIGLENPGIKHFIRHELPALREMGAVVIANLSGATIEEYTEGAALLNGTSIDMIELNISCPNVRDGGMAFGLDPARAASVVAPVRKACSKPLIVKLSPNAPDIKAVAAACVNKGADALSVVNTFTGMAIDIKKRAPVFNNITAGLSGPAIRPIALRITWELAAAVNVPVIGLGGIASACDALEFLMAGAAAVEVGAATFCHPQTMIEIIEGIKGYMIENSVSCLNELKIKRQQ